MAGGELGVRCRGEGTEGEASDGGRRFIASEPVEKGSEDRQRETDHGRVARVVEIPDRKCDIVERGQWVAVLGLEAGQTARDACFGIAVAAFLGDQQTAALGVHRRGGISLAARIPCASASHRRVEPSTSVNKNVTTPEGAAAVDTHAE